MPPRGPHRRGRATNRAQVFRKDGSYIVTGGVGGLGLFLAAVMASAGCGRIVLTSRSQPNPQAQKTIARLRCNGADIVVECGNIADPDTAARLVTAATATGLPLRGVLHAAAVVDDATAGNITDELIERDWSPKVFGAWYLHQAAAGAAPGLVLQLLVGGGAAGFARTGRVRGGEQLAGRVHRMAAQPWSPGHRNRLGRMGSDRPRRGACATR